MEDVRKRVGKLMGPGKGGSILVHVGTNDTDKVGTTELLESYRHLVRVLKGDLFPRHVTRCSSSSTLTNKLHCSEGHGMLTPSILKQTVTYGDRRLAVASANCWNPLPNEVKNAESLASFRRKLKTHLFKQAFLI